jgi:Tol biopolymer transport system component
MRRARKSGLIAIAAVVGLAVSGCTFVARVSVDASGGDPNGGSISPSLSGDGRFVAFTTSATDLVPGGQCGVVRRDVRRGVNRCVSVTSAGDKSVGAEPSISADGRFVAFDSGASLVPGDGPFSDVYVRDLELGTTTLVSVAADGGPADSGSSEPSISADGRTVAFASGASNLLQAGDGNGTTDIYVRDLDAGVTRRVSVDSAGQDPNQLSVNPAINGDGHLVAFTSSASDLVAGDTNGHDDVFVRDLAAGVTERVSAGPVFDSVNTTNGSAAISANGRVVAFVTTTFDSTGEEVFSRVFARDRRAGTTALVSVDVNDNDPDASSGQPAVSGSGRFVAFSSAATDLVAADTNGVGDVFIRDRRTGTTRRASLDGRGREANGPSGSPDLSADGRYVGFASRATNLVAHDGTGTFDDVFIRAVITPTVTSVAPATLSRGSSADLTIHGTGFQSGARALVIGSGGATVTATTVVSDTELLAHVQVAPDAPTGERDVLVYASGTGPGASATGYGLCSGCVTIT